MASTKTELSILLKRKYSDQFLVIVNENGTYKCDTENQPKFKLKENPFNDFKLPQQSDIKLTKDCRDLAAVNFRNNTVQGCLEDKELNMLVHRFNKICRY